MLGVVRVGARISIHEPVFQRVVDRRASCAGGRTGPHKGHSVNRARENPVNRSYRPLIV
jgi:hypothetical protein